MPTRPFLTSGLIACVLMTSGCLTASPASPPPPLLTLPAEARKPCVLPVLPESPTEADLEAAYMARGQNLALCNGWRDLAVQTFDAQQRALQPPPRPFWARLLGG